MRSFLSLLAAGLLASPSLLVAASDYQLTLNNIGSSSYNLTAVSSSDVYGGSLPVEDPTINLIKGKRYGITVTNGGAHPLEIIGRGANAAQDSVLLSMTVAGTLEGDAGIGWTQSGNLIEFTVTQSLLDAMRVGGRVPGYRCQVHTTAMRGFFAQFGGGAPIDNPILPTIAVGSRGASLVMVAEGLDSPVTVVPAHDGTGRAFIVDQVGLITILDMKKGQLDGSFLDVTKRLVPLGIEEFGGYDERGLLGMALSPDFSRDGKIYTYTSEPVSGTADYTIELPDGREHDHESVIAEWTVSKRDPNQIDPASRRELLRFSQPQFNHNGGAMHFGADGFLYIATGDGGGADDQDGTPFPGGATVGHGETGNAQNLDNLLGKVLRIDVLGSDGPNGQYGIPPDNPLVGRDGLDEIYAWGFRNPFRFSFDEADGTLWLADVGQNKVEEINIVFAGRNYGWRYREGTFPFDPNGTDDGFVSDFPPMPEPDNLQPPVAQYDHDDGIAVIGGFVYRGALLPDFQGRYIFGDFGAFAKPAGRLFHWASGDEIEEVSIDGKGFPLGEFLKGFGQDHDYEILVCTGGQAGIGSSTGKVWRLVPVPGSETPTPTQTPSPTATDAPTESATPTDTASPTVTGTPTATATVTASPTVDETGTATPSLSPTPSDSPSPSATNSATPTQATPTGTDAPTATASPSASSSPTATDAPTASPTDAATATVTQTQAPTASSTQTPAPTATETQGPTPTDVAAPKRESLAAFLAGNGGGGFDLNGDGAIDCGDVIASKP